MVPPILGLPVLFRAGVSLGNMGSAITAGAEELNLLCGCFRGLRTSKASKI